jgi:hypothetical protein
MLPRIGLVSSVLLLAFGCGGPGSFNGEVAGNKLSVDDAAFMRLPDDTGATIGAFLVMADVPDICATWRANREPKNATSVGFLVFRTQGSTFLSPDKGAYTVVDLTSAPPPNFAVTAFVKNDANCETIVDPALAIGRSGTMDVERIEFKTGGSMTGRFDITFGSQNDNVTGTFNASFCDAPFPNAPNCE